MRKLLGLLVLVAAVRPASAHFIFLIPSSDQKSATMVFSDELGPDENVAISKIAKTKLHAIDAAGKRVEVKMKEQKHHYDVAVDGAQPLMIGGICEYGVLTKKGDPYLLCYYPKTVLVSSDGPDKKTARWFTEGSKELPLEVVLESEGSPKMKVVFQGKPLAGAEVVVLFDHADLEDYTAKTDEKGVMDMSVVIVEKLMNSKAQPNLIAIRVKHVEKKDGEFDGKKYAEVRHYATMTVRTMKEYRKKVEPPKVKPVPEPEEVSFVGDKKADPAATKLLSDARTARALWHKFPGFTARVVINRDGEKIPCKLDVSATGKVTLSTELADLNDKQNALIKQVKTEITSLVSHRLPGGPSETPCAFADGVEDHPQGRLILVLNDELHSSYRIRDRQILEVNRSMGEAGRFTISVVENEWNKEKTYLPAHYVVNSWDKGGNLKSSAAHRNTHIRVGNFDLPETVTVVNGSSTGLSVRTLTFSGHKLTPAASAGR